MKTELTVSLKSAFYNKNRETYYSVRFFDTWLSKNLESKEAVGQRLETLSALLKRFRI